MNTFETGKTNGKANGEANGKAAGANELDRRQLLGALGASDYLTKPVDADQLLSLLRVWLYQA